MRKKVKRPDLVLMNKQRATHKMSHKPTYTAWRSMKARCLNKNTASYKDYGGRGITICKRWLESFENFIEDMGTKPNGMQLDRIKNDKGYSKENCRWSTPSENSNNRRSSRLFIYKGEKKSIAELARIAGISRQGMRYRIESGYSIVSAVKKDKKYVKGDKR